MFCGWGHRVSCVCEICLSFTRKSARFQRNKQPIMKSYPILKGVDDMLRKPKPGERSGPVEAPWDDESFAKAYPTITEMLYATRYEDNTVRTTSTLLVFCDNGVLRICLNDRDNVRSAFFTGVTFEGALLSAENALAAGLVEWKSKAGYGNTNGKVPF